MGIPIPLTDTIFYFFALYLHWIYSLTALNINSGTTGFDSRQSLIVSTPSVVRRLVKENVQTTNGNNSYALAA